MITRFEVRIFVFYPVENLLRSLPIRTKYPSRVSMFLPSPAFLGFFYGDRRCRLFWMSVITVQKVGPDISYPSFRHVNRIAGPKPCGVRDSEDDILKTARGFMSERRRRRPPSVPGRQSAKGCGGYHRFFILVTATRGSGRL